MPFQKLIIPLRHNTKAVIGQTLQQSIVVTMVEEVMTVFEFAYNAPIAELH